MKKSTILQLIFAVVMLVWMIGLSLKTYYQPTIVYVHSNYLFENYLGTIESYKQLESKTQAWGNNLDSLSKKYRASFTAYQKQAANLTTVDKEKLSQQLKTQEQQFNHYHQSVEQMKSEEDQKLSQAAIKQIDAYLKEYALEKGYDMILAAGTASALVYSEQCYDITDAALVYINKKYRGEQ